MTADQVNESTLWLAMIDSIRRDPRSKKVYIAINWFYQANELQSTLRGLRAPDMRLYVLVICFQSVFRFCSN